MQTVTSRDGTRIAYDRQGSGPAVILVDGALNYQSSGSMARLSELLAPHMTVFSYDRRGRGESGDSQPFAVEREVEDIAALIEAAGGSAFVYGISSGACLALEAAVSLGSKISRLALYEPPYDAGPAAEQQWQDYRKGLAELLAAGRRGDAVALFMKLVGIPEEGIAGMRQAPMWPMLEAIAPTLAYDAAVMGATRGAPVERLSQISVPTLVMDGGENLTLMPFMHATAATLSKALPNCRQRTLPGQTHDVNPEVLAPVLIEFFTT